MKSFLLVGNPNTGKSTIFNALTGLHQKVGNYPGVTVEKNEGTFHHHGQRFHLVDLPGAYSLTPTSPDEEIVASLLVGRQIADLPIDGVILIADATNLERNLYLASQVIDLGLPTILVVNMIDEAIKKGIHIDRHRLAHRFGVPVVVTAAHRKQGIGELKDLLAAELPLPLPLFSKLKLPRGVATQLDAVARLLPPAWRGVHAEALRLLARDDQLEEYPALGRESILEIRAALQSTLTTAGINWRACETESRYALIEECCRDVVMHSTTTTRSWGDRLDAITTHVIAGPILFLGLMAIVFQALFSWSARPMALIDHFFAFTSTTAAHWLPPGPLGSLLSDGILAGIGAVVVFVPQIACLFFFIALLEDSGYMPRAAFVMDRLMAKFGLHGKAFIPLISSFACAIPGIMATRTIESRRDRIITMMIAPLMSCSARIPVYTLLIGACIPPLTVMGFLNLKGMVLFGLYLLGIVAAVVVAFILKRTLLTSHPLPLLIEMPPFRLPQVSVVGKKTWERTKLFLTNAGTIIFALSIVLWFVTSYPKSESIVSATANAAIMNGSGASTAVRGGTHATEFTPHVGIEGTIAGRAGKFIEPIIAPLGFNWKIGIGLIASFAAREVFVSTMAIIYRLEGSDERSTSLIAALRADTRPDGTPVFTPLVALSLLVFYVLACQCMSTVAVVKRETGSWRWPIFMVSYMTVLAYGASLFVYQGGRLLGF